MKIAFFEVTQKEKNYIKKKLSRNFDLQFYQEPLTDGFDSKAILDASVISPFIYSVVSAKIISQIKKLKLIATRSTGFNHIDLTAAKKRKVAVANVPYYGENTVAEHTFALILALSRNLHKAYVRTSSNDFSIEGLRGFDLRGKTLGVVGAGSIGVHVIKIAKGFGMEIMAFDSKPNHILTELLDFNYVPLDELLKKSDIITLHCPYNQFTHHLINMNNIKKVKKGALFINTARSGIIEPKALYYAIEKNIFSGAGLDVFEGEELLKEENQMLTKNVSVEHLETLLKRNILLRRENVIITPHIAFDSMEAIERILDTTVENIISFLEGKNYHKVI
ncbi:MAG: hydroxyacid dehydrogenase [Ignavibacteria bacterium GWA2_35_9]|nr:MAG: hydroxyacid dehydrogenase [Ignavibacteria bacterium GWA2_35_9]OGU53100.1 MAG: hydroxyacid dehydrogenase [Ignavibacteria bacterium GWC2_36_12]